MNASAVSRVLAIPGMRTFLIVAVGQLISTFGSRLDNFGMGIWVYEKTGSTMQFAFILLLTAVPAFLISLVAGVIVDRWDRRWVMIWANAGAALSTLVIMLLAWADRLEVWHVYVAILFNSIFDTIQFMAFFAAIAQLVPKEYRGQASGIMRTGNSIGQIIGPVLAGAIMVSTQLKGLLLIDFVSFLAVIAALLAVRFPKLETTGATRPGKGPVWREALYGWTYMRARTGLVALLVFETVLVFLVQVTYVLFNPLVLNIATPDVLGTIVSVGGVGGVTGGLLMSTWGGPKRRMRGVFASSFLIAIGIILLGTRFSLPLIAVIAALIYGCVPIFEGSKQVLWQTKVAADVQGRVLAMRQLTSISVSSIAYLSAGLLSDQVFGPLLDGDSVLARSVGAIIGAGTGRGIAFFYMCMGALMALFVIGASRYRPLRLVEEEVPDAA